MMNRQLDQSPVRSKELGSAMLSVLKGIAIISFSLCSLVHARADERQSRSATLRFGGGLGGGFADWIGKDADGMLPGEEAVPKPAIAAGVMAALDTGRLLGLGIEPFRLMVQPELVYATKGTRLERNGEYRGSQFNTAYLQAGLLLRFEYAVAERATPYIVLGPELGFLRSAEYHNSLGDTSNAKEDFKSTDVGLILGLGTMFEMPPYGALGLELRADLGLVSIDGRYANEIRNATLTLLLVYLY
jgi:opacity protein-like surface antigen